MGWKIKVLLALLLIAGAFLVYPHLSEYVKDMLKDASKRTVEAMGESRRRAQAITDDRKFKDFVAAARALAAQGADFAAYQAKTNEHAEQLRLQLAELEQLNADNPAHRDTAAVKERTTQVRELLDTNRELIDGMYEQAQKVDPAEAQAKIHEAQVAAQRLKSLHEQSRKYLGDEELKATASWIESFLKKTGGE